MTREPVKLNVLSKVPSVLYLATGVVIVGSGLKTGTSHKDLIVRLNGHTPSSVLSCPDGICPDTCDIEGSIHGPIDVVPCYGKVIVTGTHRVTSNDYLLV